MTETTHQEHPKRNHHRGSNNNNNRKRNNNNNNWESRNGKSRRQNGHAAGGAAAAAVACSKPLCSVCNKVEEPKYKCPKCREKYCSIQCCRDHKERGCSTNINTAVNTAESSSSAVLAPSKYLPREELAKLAKLSPLTSQRHSQEHGDNEDDDDDDMEEGWKITEAMTEAVQNSDWLKNELKDEGLRHLISGIIAAPAFVRRNQKTTKQEDELERAKTDYPNFKGFLDKLGVLTNVLQRHGQAADTDLEEWLHQEGHTQSAELVLTPIAREEVSLPPVQSNSDGEADDDESSGDAASSSDASSASDEE